MRYLLLLIMITFSLVYADTSDGDAKYYRELSLTLRKSAQFKVPLLNQDQIYDYQLEFGDPVYLEPIINDTVLINNPAKFYRSFWDRIFLKDGSRIILNGEEIPLTCVFISGQDNRFSGNTDPRFPQFIMRVYLVANDFSCVGPINPGWPSNGGKEETWDTYIYYEIKDPTIMLPIEAKIRYRWNEFHSVLVR